MIFKEEIDNQVITIKFREIMYAPILDRELKRASNFELGKDYYVKNGNGNWYKGQLKNLDTWHDIDTADGRKRVSGRSIDSGVGIKSEDKIYELDLGNTLQLPKFPEYFIFGDKKVKIEELSVAELRIILIYRWNPKRNEEI